ncbi:hypothetical protein HPP92_028266 [Vanilla planifolia]|uniref:Transmembrane 9 superfamily member n=1 Tax=Vanilla planifolia TaxID=51239 RepID=A0A835P9B6_VANPL|nr:hypothetical protein HPP92_028266 [Vanilla planifolia]
MVRTPESSKDLLQVKVNKLSSTKTQLPYSYYSLPILQAKFIVDSAENLGEVLRGDRIENSPYVAESRFNSLPWGFHVGVKGGRGKEDIIFTYDVEFQESEIKWASRWDSYLLMTDDQIHWFSIVNSLMIVLFLSGMLAMIIRTLYRDISKYNQLETQEEAQEETGWKLVHGDVFRPPNNSDLLCIYVGTESSSLACYL